MSSIKVLVINGSPKGKYSITLQTSLFLQKKNPDVEFAFTDYKTRDKAQIEAADLLIFSYPVYTFIAPSQLHYFIERLKSWNLDLSGKFATQITTSKHFYDITAHRFVQENCQDLGLKYIRGLSQDMDDLLTEQGQKDALGFFSFVKWSVANNICEKPCFFAQKANHIISTIPDEPAEKAASDVVIVADLKKDDASLKAMIDRFSQVVKCKTRVVNIREFPFKGGCVSCFNCAVSGKCIYKDGFDTFLRENIQNADAIVIAFSISDHSMGPLFKVYDDRQFCNGHRTVTSGKPFAYLVSGNLDVEENLKTIIEARAEVGGNYLCGVATDQTNPDAEIDAVAKKLEYAIANRYTQPANFYGVGGMKIFRDLIWLMQGMMKADHKFYKEHGFYDFPQQQRMTMLKMYLVGALISSPKLKSKLGSKMTEGMLAPYQKLLNSVH